MKVMRFASFRGKSHFSLKSVIGEPDPLYYPLVPDIKIKPSGSNQNSILDVNAMIPVCYTKTSDDENFIMMGNEKCDLFQPVITDMGVCNSFNPSPTLDLLNPSFFTESFSKAFEEDLKMNDSFTYPSHLLYYDFQKVNKFSGSRHLCLLFCFEK